MQRLLDLLIRAVDWIGRIKDTWEISPWFWRAIWFLLGPGVIGYGSYEVELPVAGKVFFFVLLMTMWAVAAYYWTLRREKLLGTRSPIATPVSAVDTSPNHPISYVELAQICVDKLGWDFSDNWQEYDFAHAVAHGCNYGHVELDGKPGDASGNYKSMYLPAPIPKSAWRENTLKIWVDKKANVPLNKADNWDVIVASLGGTAKYRDPQVLDPHKALAWLGGGGAKYKGEFKASHEAQQERVRARWPDFKPWDAKDKFELYEAACLWFLFDPMLPMPDRPRALYQQWKVAIENGGMPVLFTEDGLDNAIMSGLAKHGSAVGIQDGKPLVTPHTNVVRDVLVGWAEHHNEKPLFLFPEERGA